MDKTNYGAGLKNGKIKSSAGVEYDINAVIEVTGDKEQVETEIKGDDELKVTFVSNVTENLSIKANAISFDVLQAITSNAMASSADGIEMPLGTLDEMNPPYIEVWAETAGKSEDGTVITIKKIWHKVQIKSVKVNQSSETEFNVEMAGIAYQTDEDVEGNDLPSKRVATLHVV